MDWTLKPYRYEKDQKQVYDLFLKTDEEALNAIQGVLDFGSGKILDVQYGSSMLRYWLHKPVIEGSTVKFSGIRPFGFEGGDDFFVLRVVMTMQDAKVMASMKDFEVLAHDGEGGTLFQGKKTSVIIDEAEVINDAMPQDLEAPYPFYPILSLDGEGRAFISFHAQDNQSGVDRYEFQFKKAPAQVFLESGVFWLEEAAERPYQVRVVDRAGNERTEQIDYKNAPRISLTTDAVAWYSMPIVWILALICCLLMALLLRKRFFKKGA